MAKKIETQIAERQYYYIYIVVAVLTIGGMLIGGSAYVMTLGSDIKRLSDDMQGKEAEIKNLSESLVKLKILETKIESFDKDMAKIDSRITGIQDKITETSQTMVLLLKDLLKKQ